MPSTLIDDHGELWPANSRQLRERYGSPFSGSEFARYVVVNLGFVALTDLKWAAQVRLRPSFVGPATWQSLHAWLALSKAERVVVTWLHDGWSDELHLPAAAMRRLEQLQTGGGAARPSDFLARPLTEHDLPAGSPWRTILGGWQRLSVAAHRPELQWLLSAALGDRFILVRPSRTSGRLVFQAIGAGLFRDCDPWRTCAIGAPMEETPDRSFGRWAADGYGRVLREGVPAVEDVDAIVRWPDKGRVRLRYKRLIAPLRDHAGALHVLGGSSVDSRIDLRARRL